MNFPDYTCPFCRELGQPCDLGHAIDAMVRGQRAERICNKAMTALHGDGWLIGETGGSNGWLTTGQRGEQEIHAVGKSQSEAWAAALAQAESMPLIVEA
jgi:hypothetical protein